MIPRTREHKEDRMSTIDLFFNATSNIPKDTGRDDMNSSTVHAIWMIVPSSLAKKIIFYSGGTIITA